MDKIKLTINGQEVEISNGLTIKDVLVKYFTVESEFVVQKNSSISLLDFNKIRVEENDILEVISYLEGKIADNVQNESHRQKNS